MPADSFNENNNISVFVLLTVAVYGEQSINKCLSFFSFGLTALFIVNLSIF